MSGDQSETPPNTWGNTASIWSLGNTSSHLLFLFSWRMCFLSFHSQSLSPSISAPCSVQFNHSVVSNSATPWTEAHQAFLSITSSQSLLKLLPIESVMRFNQLTPCWPLLLLPSIIPSIGVFSKESFLHIRWPKYWRFSFSISPSNEYSGLSSFSQDFGSQENKVCHCFHCFPIYFPLSDGTGCRDLSFLNV